MVLAILITTALAETDCESYNPSSARTLCADVDLCCDEKDCWYHLTEEDLNLEDPDTVLDFICDFGEGFTGPIQHSLMLSNTRPFLHYGPWLDYPEF